MARKRGVSGGDESGFNGDMGDEAQEFVPAVSVHRLPPPALAPEMTDAEQKTDDLLDRMGGGEDIGTGYVLVTRALSSGNSTEEHVLKCPSDLYTWEDLLEHVREHYGAGNYRVRLYIKGEHGRHVMRGNRLAPIAARLKPDVQLPVKASGETDTVKVMAMMMEQSQRNTDAMLQRLDALRAPTGQADSLTQFVTGLAGLAAAVSPFVVPLLTNRKQGGDEIDKLARLMTVTKGVRELTESDAPSAPAAGTATGMDAVVAGLQALPQVLPMILATRGGRPALPAPVAGAPVATVPATAPARGQPSHPLYPMFTMLVDKGRQRANVEAEARTLAGLLDSAPPDQRAGFVEALQLEDFIKQVVEIQPDVLDVLPWFLELHDALLDILLPEPDDEAIVDPPGNNHANSVAPADASSDTGSAGGQGDDQPR